jgi:SWI/SNF-related matrix-associated actin-dependent regulator 1 of chromatin subfamily A
MTAYRLSGEAKVAGAIEFIDTLLEAGAKFLLFAHHKCVLDAYEDFCSKKKVKTIRIDGSVDPERRHKRVTEFQHNEDVRVAILSIAACSQGLTLTAASTVVFAELTWTPSIMQQAEDRAHRISQ